MPFHSLVWSVISLQSIGVVFCVALRSLGVRVPVVLPKDFAAAEAGDADVFVICKTSLGELCGNKRRKEKAEAEEGDQLHDWSHCS